MTSIKAPTSTASPQTGLMSGLRRALGSKGGAETVGLYEAAAAASTKAGASETSDSTAAWARLVTHCQTSKVDLAKVLSRKVGETYPMDILFRDRHVETLVSLTRGMHAYMRAHPRNLATISRPSKPPNFVFRVSSDADLCGTISTLTTIPGASQPFCLVVRPPDLARSLSRSIWGDALQFDYWCTETASGVSSGCAVKARGAGFRLAGTWGQAGFSEARVTFESPQGDPTVYTGSLISPNIYSALFSSGRLCVPGQGVAVGDFGCTSAGGMGQINYEDGGWYEGAWDAYKTGELPIPYGPGQSMRPTVSTDGCELYAGTFMGGRLHGRSFYAQDYEKLYVGNWRAGKRHGPGMNRAADGTLVEGNFVNDLPEGICRVSENSERICAEEILRIFDEARLSEHWMTQRTRWKDAIKKNVADLKALWPQSTHFHRALFAEGEEVGVRRSPSADAAEPVAPTGTDPNAAATQEQLFNLIKELKQTQEALAKANARIEAIEVWSRIRV